jgi:hypothetical protein
MSSYYDIDAILTDAQKVPCTFELTVPGLGFLEGNMSGEMKQGSKVELPLWLGEMLALRYVFFRVCYLLARYSCPKQSKPEHILTCNA